MTILEKRFYSPQEIDNAILIIHPNSPKYNIKPKLEQTFEQWSNFTKLTNPIIDDLWNMFCDSESYYFAQRLPDNATRQKVIDILSDASYQNINIKKNIYSQIRKNHNLDQDEKNRVLYMRNAIRHKFDNNKDLQDMLIGLPADKQIIEYTYRWDILFGIDQNNLFGANVLWKLLMEYRDDLVLYD